MKKNKIPEAIKEFESIQGPLDPIAPFLYGLAWVIGQRDNEYILVKEFPWGFEFSTIQKGSLKDMDRMVIEAVEKRKQYWLMDGRANYSIDDATVLEICDTEDEARKDLDLFGSDTCIVKADTVTGDKELVYSPLWKADES